MEESYHCDGLQLSGHVITDTELKKVTLKNAIIIPVNTKNITCRVRGHRV